MSFVTEFGQFDCMWGAPRVSETRTPDDEIKIQDYLGRFESFKPSFMGEKMTSLNGRNGVPNFEELMNYSKKVFDSGMQEVDPSPISKKLGTVRMNDENASIFQVGFGHSGAKPDKMHDIDLSNISVGFGGFSPMALSDSNASMSEVEASERRLADFFENKRKAMELDAARASEPFEFIDDQGNVWTCVTLDGSAIRIERCQTQQESLTVPDEINGMPVQALAPDALNALKSVEEIVCSDNILSIGGCCFRNCTNLRRLVYPKLVTSFESHWHRSCNKLEELVLPGLMTVLKPDVFDVPNLKRVVMGKGLVEIQPGAFEKSKLTEIAISPDNETLMTDGKAIYTKDGSWMVCLAVPVESYEVLSGCKAVAKKGFSSFEQVKQVVLPESIEALAEFALSRTSIESFTAPTGLQVIAEKAFFRCKKLTEVNLNEGLTAIDNDAFTGTAIKELKLPKSIASIGSQIAQETGLTYSGPDATFSIAEGSYHLTLDEQGALYGLLEGNVCLIRVMDSQITELVVRPDATVITASACYRCKQLERVQLPDGLKVIGVGAFKDCQSLTMVNIPDSVRRIDDEAFLCTSLASMYLPASLEYLGTNALVSFGAHHGKVPPAVCRMEIAPNLTRWYLASGMLCEHMDDGTSRVLMYLGGRESVTIPEEITAIAPYAFNNAKGIMSLTISDRITKISICGLAIDCLVENIHIDLVEPVEGHDHFNINFPNTNRSAQQVRLAFGMCTKVDVADIMNHYDNAIINGFNFDKLEDGGISVYEQATRIIERLQDPVFMTLSIQQQCEQYLTLNIQDVCVEIARHDDRKSIDALVDLGFLNEDNLLAVIDAVGGVQDAAMTGYLLELKRRYFKQDYMDFDL